MFQLNDLRHNRDYNITRKVDFDEESLVIKVDLSSDLMLRTGTTNQGHVFVDLDGGPFLYETEMFRDNGLIYTLNNYQVANKVLTLNLSKDDDNRALSE